jgi:p-aminobenzoyl-glutamate transporter AbgT
MSRSRMEHSRAARIVLAWLAGVLLLCVGTHALVAGRLAGAHSVAGGSLS